jgi:threonine dehydrogenase-like Zn-dependent dehydrogenase
MLERAAHRGVTLLGVAGYGPRPPDGPDASTLPVAHRLLVSEQRRWAPLVTHVYPLPPFREALEAAAGRSREEARKVLLDPGL